MRNIPFAPAPPAGGATEVGAEAASGVLTVVTLFLAPASLTVNRFRSRELVSFFFKLSPPLPLPFGDLDPWCDQSAPAAPAPSDEDEDDDEDEVEVEVEVEGDAKSADSEEATVLSFDPAAADPAAAAAL